MFTALSVIWVFKRQQHSYIGQSTWILESYGSISVVGIYFPKTTYIFEVLYDWSGRAIKIKIIEGELLHFL